jgi:pilus assembly protein Flp/PilA
MSRTMFKRFLTCDSGSTAIEYGLIAALLGIGLVVSLGNLGGNLNNMLVNINDRYASR